MEHTAVVLVAHGTRDPRGVATIQQAAERVAEALPAQEVALGFVDVQEPAVADLLAEVSARHDAVVVVPLLLSRGYHVEVDITEAAAPHPGVTVTDPLGPDPLLAALLADRLEEADAPAAAHVVLAAAGSSRPRAAEDVEVVADRLAEEWSSAVTVGYGASATPTVADAVTAARESGAEQVAIAAYLLAEGHFHDQLAEAGGDVVTEPLAADDAGLDTILAIVLERLERHESLD